MRTIARTLAINLAANNNENKAPVTLCNFQLSTNDPRWMSFGTLRWRVFWDSALACILGLCAGVYFGAIHWHIFDVLPRRVFGVQACLWSSQLGYFGGSTNT